MGFIRTISVKRAKSYYYEKDSLSAPNGEGENSLWHGKIAEHLGLSGRVDNTMFKSLVQGDLLSTKQADHRAGYDFVFSPPKSFSLMALHYGDNRLLDAHNDAVKETLKWMEENVIQYRHTSNGMTVKVKSDNMLATTFLHTTSRDNDPLLHSHAIIMNLTATENGYRALSNELIFDNQQLVGKIYQNTLAQKTKDLGYQLKQFHNRFEIDGVSPEAIKIFSKRSQEIDSAVNDLVAKFPNLAISKLRDMANFDTRANKEFIDADILKARWEGEYKKEELYQKPIPAVEISRTDEEIFNKALSHVTKSEMCFRESMLLETIITQNRGDVSIEKAEDIIKQSASKLVHVFDSYYSTPEQIDMENRIVAEVRQGKAGMSALMPADTVENRINEYETLTDGQRECLRHILTTKDRISIIQGDAGTGKTFVIDKLRESLEKEGIDTAITGLAYTGKAAQELKKAANINAQTLQSYLNKPSKQEQIFIVDESSMLSSKDMLHLLDLSKNSRIIFIGDGKQLQAIGAGKMFIELQLENVVKTVEMKQVLRQETELTKAIVANISSYQEGHNNEGLTDTIDLLKNNDCIINVDNMVSVGLAALNEYDEQTVFLTSTRAEKNLINSVIRSNTQRTENEIKFNIKEQINGSLFSSDYEKGDLLYCNNKYLTVRQTDEQNNVLSCTDNNGKCVTINPRYVNEISIYRHAERNFSEGEKITFLKNDYKLNVQNGLTGTIEHIKPDGLITVKTAANETINFNIKNYPYLDYAYAQTICKSQGSTYKRAILVGDQFNTESFYTAASRCKTEFKIITTDIDKLEYSIQNEQSKTSTRSINDRMLKQATYGTNGQTIKQAHHERERE